MEVILIECLWKDCLCMNIPYEKLKSYPIYYEYILNIFCRKEIKPKLIIPVCISPHEGRSIANITIPMHVDTLFTLLFTDNKFLMDFHEVRRTTDYLATPWTESANGEKTRTVTLTVALNASVGPKVSNVTETQVSEMIYFKPNLGLILRLNPQTI